MHPDDATGNFWLAPALLGASETYKSGPAYLHGQGKTGYGTRILFEHFVDRVE